MWRPKPSLNTIIGLSLPTWIKRKFGRLVGFMALLNQITSSTKLDVPTAHRHDVLSSKQVVIGSRYSPVAQWMSKVDLVLQDESQQYGKRDSSISPSLTQLPGTLAW